MKALPGFLENSVCINGARAGIALYYENGSISGVATNKSTIKRRRYVASVSAYHDFPTILFGRTVMIDVLMLQRTPSIYELEEHNRKIAVLRDKLLAQLSSPLGGANSSQLHKHVVAPAKMRTFDDGVVEGQILGLHVSRNVLILILNAVDRGDIAGARALVTAQLESMRAS
jgi:hypothetical protein